MSNKPKMTAKGIILYFFLLFLGIAFSAFIEIMK